MLEKSSGTRTLVEYRSGVQSRSDECEGVKKQGHKQEETYMNKYIRVCMLPAMGILTVAIVTGCASIIKGGTQTVNIRSNPAEAKATLYASSGTAIISQNTPCIVSLKRGEGYFKKGSYRLVVEKQGYQKFETMIRGQVNGWYVGGNFIFGGLIGWLIVDPATGAMWTLKPDEIDANLAAQNASFLSIEKDSLVIVLREQVPASLQSCMKSVRPSI
jgi:hypothetical protein